MTFATNGERAANVAVRTTVENEGREAPRALYVEFDRINTEHYQGQLESPLILITNPSTPRRLGDYIEKDKHGLRSCIRIAPWAYKRGDKCAADVLLHETVHQFCTEIEREPEAGYKGHGPRFAAKCNVIGDSLRLPPVFVRTKKNKGQPLCNHWPHCVRPEGYYGATDKKPDKAGVTSAPRSVSAERRRRTAPDGHGSE